MRRKKKRRKKNKAQLQATGKTLTRRITGPEEGMSNWLMNWLIDWLVGWLVDSLLYVSLVASLSPLLFPLFYFLVYSPIVLHLWSFLIHDPFNGRGSLAPSVSDPLVSARSASLLSSLLLFFSYLFSSVCSFSSLLSCFISFFSFYVDQSFMILLTLVEAWRFLSRTPSCQLSQLCNKHKIKCWNMSEHGRRYKKQQEEWTSLPCVMN